MVKLRPGGQVHQLLQLLSVTGEFPAKSLHLLGSEQFVKKLVHKLESKRIIHSEISGKKYEIKMLQVNGIREKRTVRLYKSALKLLAELHPDALDGFLQAFPENKFHSENEHILRNHRVGEAIAVCMMAGVEVRPYVLPELQKEKFTRVLPEMACFYTARHIKKVDALELNKTMYTRLVGALFNYGNVYAVFNTRNAVMKWSGTGEVKTKQELMEISRMNVGTDDVSSALLLGESPDIAMSTLIESDLTKKGDTRFDRIYPRIHFIPTNQDGIRLLKILTLPNWKEKLITTLIPAKMRTEGYGFMEYDGFWEGKYYHSHIDSDIARLVRFRDGLKVEDVKVEVICLPWQVKFLQEYLGERVTIKILKMELLEKALGV